MAEVWAEALRTAQLIRHDHGIQERVATGSYAGDLKASLTNDDVENLLNTVDDAVILVGLLHELERRGISERLQRDACGDQGELNPS